MPRQDTDRVSFRLPWIDLLVILLLIAGSAYAWMEISGKPRIGTRMGELDATRAKNAGALEEARAALEGNRQALAEAEERRDDKMEVLVGLEAEMRGVRASIDETRERDHLATDRLLDLRLEVQQAQARLRSANKDLAFIESRVAEEQERVRERQERRGQLAGEWREIRRQIASARAEMEADPPSRFPEHSSFASIVEFGDSGGDVIVSLARRVKSAGQWELGLLGGLGVGGEAESAIKEGGLFANWLLVPRRASLDFEGGIRQLTVRETDEQTTGPFAAATLRFAPSRRERLFLLAGTRYADEELGVHLGLGFGRR